MRKVVTTLGVVLLVGALAVPVLAFGPGWGRGQGASEGWGGGPGSCWRYGGTGSEPTADQKARLDELDKKFYEETASLRESLAVKSAEMDVVFASANPDAEKAKAIQKELNNLRSQMADKRLAYELEARKIAGSDRYAGRVGRGPGFGRGMRGNGPGPGPGAGPGCGGCSN
jgi:zinc resistance-associated protein